MRAAFADARNDVTVGGIILTGAGDSAFIAEADITDLATVSVARALAQARFVNFRNPWGANSVERGAAAIALDQFRN